MFYRFERPLLINSRILALFTQVFAHWSMSFYTEQASILPFKNEGPKSLFSNPSMYIILCINGLWSSGVGAIGG
jgi:hypothetical protein